MRCYDGCPDKELQAVIDDNKAAREALAGMGVRAVYFPGEEMFMGFDTEHRAVTGFCRSVRAVLNNLKG